MIPIRDVIPSRTTPWITIAILAANVLVFVWTAIRPGAVEDVFHTFGLIPAHFSWIAVCTSLFVHTGWVHFASNMISLWIFGDNVEDRMGHGRFLLFYLIAGAVAALAQTWAAPESTAPLVGASGAIAGVMGAYLALFLHSRVLVLIYLVFFVDVVEVPAVFFLGLWFVLQVLSGVGSDPTEAIGGIAFWAHAGGFLTGLSTVWIFRRRERLSVGWWSG